jgi:hypothetical protein
MTDRVEIDFDGKLRGALAARFAAEAEKRGISPADLAADIIEIVAKHNLFAAVLDD